MALLNIDTLVITSLVIMLCLALGIVFFVVMYQNRMIAYQTEIKKINEQKELELIQASIQSEEEERKRIATELHDDVNATLASARLFLYRNKDAEFDEARINQSKELLDQSIVKIRDISHKLQPASLQHLGLELSISSLVDTINRSGTITATYSTISELPRAADNVELAIYRVLQELIANILKHSGASSIGVASGSREGNINIQITHNGTGMTQEMYEALIYKKGSTGLKNIVNRLKSVSGNIHFYYIEQHGYKTEITVPLN